MTTKLSIIARNAAGQVARLYVETDAVWLPQEPKHVKAMEGFTPGELLDLQLEDQYGGVMRHVPYRPAH